CFLKSAPDEQSKAGQCQDRQLHKRIYLGDLLADHNDPKLHQQHSKDGAKSLNLKPVGNSPTGRT
ncbi:MAG: hypothetical protein ACYSW4_06265, partial [Planctomycetota bacterium]